MPQRIRREDIVGALESAGHGPGEYISAEQTWDPGYRAVQRGPRWVLIFHEGPGEADQLLAYTTALRDAGYHVQTSQMPGGGRHRLEVTRP